MSRSSPTTTHTASTPVPFSPFSSGASIYSDFTASSEAEPADLGQFSIILQAMRALRFPNAPTSANFLSNGSSSPSDTPSGSPFTYSTDLPPDTEDSDARHFHSSSSPSSSDVDSDAYISDIYGTPLERGWRLSERRSRLSDRDSVRGGTVWNQAPVASYLSLSSRNEQGEAEEPLSLAIPSLGLGAFGGALSFLAGERARLSNQLARDTSTATSSTSAPIPQEFLDNKRPTASGSRDIIPKARQKKQVRKGRRERSRNRAEKSRLVQDDVQARAEATADGSSSYDDRSSPEKASPILADHGTGVEPIFRQSARNARHSRHQFTEETATISDPNNEHDEAYVNRVMIELRTHLLSMTARLCQQFPADSRLLQALPFELDRFGEAGGFILGGEVVGAEGSSGFWQRPGLTENEKGKVHVFVDHSNILVGFLEWIKAQFKEPSASHISITGLAATVPSFLPRKPKLSHASLTLLLERGRRIGKRVLVASSPLHQSLDDMVEMGYEVSVLQRVAIKESGGTPNTNGTSTPVGNSSSAAAERPRRTRDRQSSMRSHVTSSTSGTGGYSSSLASGNGTLNSFDGSGGSSTESGYGRSGHTYASSISQSNLSKALPSSGHRRQYSAPPVLPPSIIPLANSGASIGSYGGSPYVTSNGGASTPVASPFSTPPLNGNVKHPGAVNGTRSRFREEAVDELLQLKLLQVLIAAPAPPPRGSTIVLATGDGASSQFNSDGFLGGVRQALERGWRVELVGWETGRSRAWLELASEFAERKVHGVLPIKQGGLVMVNLDNWGWDLYDSRTSV